MRILNEIPLFLIRVYRRWISPALGRGKCRYHPTCSEYAGESYRKYNLIKATSLSIWRILRCNPFSKGGYDPL